MEHQLAPAYLIAAAKMQMVLTQTICQEKDYTDTNYEQFGKEMNLVHQ